MLVDSIPLLFIEDLATGFIYYVENVYSVLGIFISSRPLVRTFWRLMNYCYRMAPTHKWQTKFSIHKKYFRNKFILVSIKEQLKAVLNQVVATTLFWTLSCAEFHWQDFHTLFGNMKNQVHDRDSILILYSQYILICSELSPRENSYYCFSLED